MPSLATIAVHPTQFPGRVRAGLLESLRSRQINHKFHYDSIKQTQKWLALHEAYSPSRTDPEGSAIYERAFEAAARHLNDRRIHLVGLGCGGGWKDARLLERLREPGRSLFYSPVDVSGPMVLTAREQALRVISPENCFPLVCDLAEAEDLPQILADSSGVRGAVAGATRLITFFGMLPNFESRVILPRVSALVQSSDYALLSANLAPGNDYEAGVRRILPLYDNALTRDWLLTLLLDVGVEAGDGKVRFTVEDDPGGEDLKRVAAYFDFQRPREVRLEDETVRFEAGEAIRLFFSYRHTPQRVRVMLADCGLEVSEQWITTSGEEGVFLVRRVVEE